MTQHISFKSIWFVSGLVVAAGMATYLDGAVQRPADMFAGYVDLDQPLYPLAPIAGADRADREAAEIAWRFIVQQTQPDTGMVNSVAGFPSTTLWDQGSYLLALIAAVKLDVIDGAEFDRRTLDFLDALARIPLTQHGLPNKVYNTKTLAMTDYADIAKPDGIGWSALDIARILLALRILEKFDPATAPVVQNVVAGWDLSKLADDGDLWGASVINGQHMILQEGRIGYEQYAARAAAMWGLDVGAAMTADSILQWRSVAGIDVPIDRRSVQRFQIINPTSSEPYILMGLEIGLDGQSHALASQVLAAQKARYDQTGHITIVSEDHLDHAPHFAYASVFSNAQDWAVVDAQGKHFPEMRTQSTKASFGWDALFDTMYTNTAVAHIRDVTITDNGWPAGIYEAS
ncbi:MAG: DUF3131 domain-containing protein, partial [Planktomarina sp.]